MNDRKLASTLGSIRDKHNRFYSIMAGGTDNKLNHVRLLEGFLDLKIPQLLGRSGPLSAHEITTKLGLHPDRGWKFLHALSLCSFLDQTGGDRGEDDAIFGLSDEAKTFFGEDGTGGVFYRDVIDFWRYVAEIDIPFCDVLKGAQLPEMVQWPPPGPSEATHLENWMAITSDGAIQSIVNSKAIQNTHTVLDVGGGDGTIAMALVNNYGCQVTLFNLPASCVLAREHISSALEVTICEGNFLTDDLPNNNGKYYDCVLFSRVLADWTPNVCKMLFEKAKRVLSSGGRLVISDVLSEGNADMCLSWEFRHIFYDSFGRAIFKPLCVYRDLLDDAGFDITYITPMSDEAFYSVIVAEIKK